MFRSSGPRSRRPAVPTVPVAHAAVRREASLLRSVQLLLATADPRRTPTAADRRERGARRRAEVIEYLRVQGGALRDEQGLVTRHIRIALGAGPGLGRLLRAMEHEGLVTRDVRGRRTYAVLLTTLTTHDASRRPAPADGEAVGAANGPVDFERFTEVLLEIVEKRLAVVDPDNRARVEQLETHRTNLRRHLADYRVALAGGAADDPEATQAFIDEHLELMTVRALEFERRTGARVDDALTETERESLRDLMLAIPVRPVAPTA